MRRALVLNATYEPLSVVPTRRAVCLVLAEKAEVLHDDEGLMRSAHLELRTPLVIRLRYMVKVPFHRRTTMSRRAVFARDAHQCQYCGGHADSIDHVLPAQPRRRCTCGRTWRRRAARATCASATAHRTRRACT